MVALVNSWVQKYLSLWPNVFPYWRPKRTCQTFSYQNWGKIGGWKYLSNFSHQNWGKIRGENTYQSFLTKIEEKSGVEILIKLCSPKLMQNPGWKYLSIFFHQNWGKIQSGNTFQTGWKCLLNFSHQNWGEIRCGATIQ